LPVSSCLIHSSLSAYLSPYPSSGFHVNEGS
jgi:hypothetical protein